MRHDYKMKAEVWQWVQIINVYVLSLGTEHGVWWGRCLNWFGCCLEKLSLHYQTVKYDINFLRFRIRIMLVYYHYLLQTPMVKTQKIIANMGVTFTNAVSISPPVELRVRPS